MGVVGDLGLEEKAPAGVEHAGAAADPQLEPGRGSCAALDDERRAAASKHVERPAERGTLRGQRLYVPRPRGGRRSQQHGCKNGYGGKDR